ncbi:MEDS domain-containing protein [Paraburkholderia fungorum]|uniref:MEDS domain-containing protein n=1 Tax=Paraburkholderia fungorum TaxID=134537 RepID=UPI0038BDFA37
MTTGNRKSGIASLGPISWGTHLCHFYETRNELLSVTANFLQAGLAQREVGVWVAPALLGPDKARHMLTRAMPALTEYIDSGQLQILDGAQLYAPSRTGFNGSATVGLWSAAINDALGRGFEGLRVAGDAVCNENTDWAALLDYEATLKHKLAASPIVGLCTYCVQGLRAAQTREIERLHDAAVAPSPAEFVDRTASKVGRRAIPSVEPQQVSGETRQTTVLSESSIEATHQFAVGPMIGHEIRNAITPLGLLARLLNTQYGHDEQLTRYALVLSRQASLLGQLAQQLMAPAHIPCANSLESEGELVVDARPAQSGHVDVDDLLAHCIQVAQAGVPGHLPINLAKSVTPILVRGDFCKLTQVFVNVMVNALKYSSPTDAVSVTAARAGCSCYISVRDNGIGITSRELKTIFKLYARGLEGRALGVEGLGLGLSVVRDIVVSCGGTVEAFSEGPGTGSEFVVRLPLAKPPISAPENEDAFDANVRDEVCVAQADAGAVQVLTNL